MDEIELPPDYSTYEPFLVGILVDVDGYHGDVPRLNAVKDQIVQFITSLDSEDRVWIFNAANTEIPTRHGKSVCDIAQHYMTFDPLSVGEALKFTAGLFNVEGRDYQRVIFYITDRYHISSDRFVREALEVIGNRGLECRVYLIGIGDKYHAALLDHAGSRSLDQQTSLKSLLLELLKVHAAK